MNTLYLVLQLSINISWAIMLLGYLIYALKFENVDSWENGITYLFTQSFRLVVKLYNWIYDEATGKTLDSYIINSALILNDTEVLELTKSLESHPFDTTTLSSYTSNSNGISWFDISSNGLASSYTNIKNEEIDQISSMIIRNYFMRTRKVTPRIYIKVVSPTRLYFAIPLSENGRKFLDKQNETISIPIQEPANIDPLEEEIYLFGDVTEDTF